MRKLTSLLLIAALLAALAACNRPAAAIPNPPLVLGEKYLTDLDYEQALLQFDQAIAIEPKNPRGYLGKADALLHLNRQAEAAEALGAAAKQCRPQRAWLNEVKAEVQKSAVDGYIALSSTYDKLGWREIALALLRRVCEELPEESRLREALEKLVSAVEGTQANTGSTIETTTRVVLEYARWDTEVIKEYDAQGRPIKTECNRGHTEIRYLIWREDNTLAQEKRMFYHMISGELMDYVIVTYGAQGATGDYRQDIYNADGTLRNYRLYQGGELLDYNPDGTPQ